MVQTPAFTQIYNQLNPAQRQAVDTIEGPVMVVAGPGTGKTQVLAARIANILLKTDSQPLNILALTFTESAATNMRERVVKMIGHDGYYVHITTFHSFCQEVIESHPEYFPIDRDSQPLTDLERYNLFQTLISELSLEVLKPLNRPLFYLKEIIKSISDLKREGVSPSEFASVVASEKAEFELNAEELTKTERLHQQKILAKQQELIVLYEAYQKRLRAQLRYDFDDMIALVVEAFQTQELLLLEYQEKFLYFLVDEYQDTNSAQNKVVELLASYWGQNANLFVVGDPHQSIYRFQGASVENILRFAHRFESAKLVTLSTGYRCPQPIYDAAHQLISHNQLTAPQGLVSNGRQQDLEQALTQKLDSAGKSSTNTLETSGITDAPISVFRAPSQTVELLFVVEEIKKLLVAKVPPEEIAVLYRHNADSLELQDMLSKSGIPYELRGGLNILTTPEIQQLLFLFQVIGEMQSKDGGDQLFEVMLYDWIGLDALSVMKVGRIAGKSNQNMLEIIANDGVQFSTNDTKKTTKTTDITELTNAELESLQAFVTKLRKWVVEDARLVFSEFFEKVITESGYLQWITTQPNEAELITNLNSLYREVKALTGSERNFKLKNFLVAIDLLYEHNLSLNAEDLNVIQGAVHLSTAHQAKGQEWEYVFVIHVYDGKWSNPRKIELLPLPDLLLENTDLSKKEHNEDERRLFYVTLTRAKKQVFISYPQSLITANRSKEVIASMFIGEIGEKGIVAFTDHPVVDNAQKHLEVLLAEPPAQPISVSQEAFYRELVRNYKLSVTGLNKYLQDPQAFVYDVLLRVPRSKSATMAFGTAMHATLEKLFTVWQEERTQLDLAEVQAYFEHRLARELLTAEDFDRRLKHGKEVLGKYYSELSLEQAQPVYIERFFGSGFSKTVLDDIPLTGRIDRVDWINQQDKTVRVIDYKTGKSRSVGDIEGKTVAANLSEREQALPESIRGPYKRQLLFYKLLAELDQSFVPTVTEGVFDFVEPDKNSGKFIQRSFELGQEDVDELKDLIREVMGEIRELKFLDI